MLHRLLSPMEEKIPEVTIKVTIIVLCDSTSLLKGLFNKNLQYILYSAVTLSKLHFIEKDYTFHF